MIFDVVVKELVVFDVDLRRGLPPILTATGRPASFRGLKATKLALFVVQRNQG